MGGNGKGSPQRSFSWRALIFRWAVTVAAFVGLGASCQVCPFCGQPGCVGGGVGSALIGVITATVATVGVYWRRLQEWFHMRFSKK